MKKLLTVIFLMLSVSSFSQTRQKHKYACENYSIEIIDNKDYWDSIAPGIKIKKITAPMSNLIWNNDSFPSQYLGQINKEIQCALKGMNESRQRVGENIDTSFQIISAQVFKSNSGIKGCYILAETKDIKMQVGVIGIFTDKELLLYRDGNDLELKIKLFCVEQKNSNYIVYGEQQGNPDNHYGGKFKLIFTEKKRNIEYEYYEDKN